MERVAWEDRPVCVRHLTWARQAGVVEAPLAGLSLDVAQTSICVQATGLTCSTCMTRCCGPGKLVSEADLSASGAGCARRGISCHLHRPQGTLTASQMLPDTRRESSSSRSRRCDLDRLRRQAACWVCTCDVVMGKHVGHPQVPCGQELLLLISQHSLVQQQIDHVSSPGTSLPVRWTATAWVVKGGVIGQQGA